MLGRLTPSARLSASSERLAIAALIMGACAIAFSPIFVRLSELGPTATAFHRVFLALPALWLWNRAETRSRRALDRPAGWSNHAGLALAGVFFAGDLAFWHWSVRFTSVANSTLLANVTPIFVVLGGALLFRERFSRKFLAGMALAIAGCAVLMGQSVALGTQNLLGDVLGVVTAAFYGAYILTVGRLRAHFSTATIMSWSGLASAAVLLPVTLLSGESMIAETAYGWAVLFGLALVSQAGGQSLIAHALAHLPAAFSSVSLLIQPVVAAGLAWALLNETLAAQQALGGGIVLAGIILARLGSR